MPTSADEGFGLVEVIISLAVLLTVLVASAYLMDNVVQQAGLNREKVSAAELAENYMETISNDSLTTLESYISRDTDLTTTPVSVANVNYTVWSHLEWATTGNGVSPCAAGDPPQVIRATITVKWGTNQSLAETAIVNPPYGSVVAGDGYLSIQIDGEGGANSPPADTASLVNVQVMVTPQPSGTTVTYNPDEYGCVYLEEPAGTTYQVELASPTGGPAFITSQEQTSAAATATNVDVKTAGLVYAATFHYDELGTVNWSASGAVPAATGMPVSISNGGNLSGNGTLVVNAAGSNGTTDNLFPYSTPYSIWYGDCSTIAGVTQEQPASPTTFSITQKGTTTASIAGLYTLSIQATRSAGFTSGEQPSSATAQVSDSSAPGDGCPANDEPSASSPEIYGLVGFTASPTGSTTTYVSQTAVLPQTYVVKIPYDGTSYSFTVSWSSSGWVVGSTTYAFTSVVPVTLP